MKRRLTWVLLVWSFGATAATTIDADNRFSYGANVGWADWRGDTNNGAIIGEYVCSGYIYSANLGWIHLGSGFPANAIQYQNNSGTDVGVNFDSLGNLRGFAYGANIGWINFENNGAPRVDLATGKFSGYAYSANCGWISLSNAVAYVKTSSVAPGMDADHDGLPDAWEIQYLGGTNAMANADADGDGQSNLQEYLAGTNPTNANSVLRITYAARDEMTPDSMTLHWDSVPTRCYTIESRDSLGAMDSWTDLVSLGLGSNSATFNVGVTNQTEFYRIRAYRPLGP